MKNKILMVEDEKVVGENFEKILSFQNFKVTFAKDYRSAVILAKKILPDLIVCDLHHKDENLCNVYLELNSDSSTRNIPIVFISSMDELIELKNRLFIKGNSLLPRPIVVNDFLKSIKLNIGKLECLEGESKIDIQNDKEIFTYKSKIYLKNGSRPYFVKISDIQFIKAENQYSKLYRKNHKTNLVSKSLKEWEKRLPQQDFLRIHRSYLVNVNYINDIKKNEKGTLTIYLEGFTDPLFTSRRYTARIKAATL